MNISDLKTRPDCHFEKYLECVKLMTEAYKFLEMLNKQMNMWNICTNLGEKLGENHRRLRKLMDEMENYIK